MPLGEFAQYTLRATGSSAMPVGEFTVVPVTAMSPALLASSAKNERFLLVRLVQYKVSTPNAGRDATTESSAKTAIAQCWATRRRGECIVFPSPDSGGNWPPRCDC